MIDPASPPNARRLAADGAAPNLIPAGFTFADDYQPPLPDGQLRADDPAPLRIDFAADFAYRLSYSDNARRRHRRRVRAARGRAHPVPDAEPVQPQADGR